jgi:hypothetical protein
VPFDADKLSRSLFAATESLGQPDPFLARELADSVLHFLAEDTAGTVPTTAQIAEIAVKVVRELGQPSLSRAYEERQSSKKIKPAESPATVLPSSAAMGPAFSQIAAWIEQDANPVAVSRRIAASCLREFGLTGVYSRDIVTAHYQGIIQLHALEMPLELGGLLVPGDFADANNMLERLDDVRQIAGGFVAIAGPEYHLIGGANQRGVSSHIDEFIRTLRLGLQLTGLRAIVNLNSSTAPSSAEWVGDGPLFAPHRAQLDRNTVDARADALCERLAEAPAPPWRIDWHLAARDFFPDTRVRSLKIARLVLRGAPIALVMDRPYKPLHLAEGLNQKTPALLSAVSLNLPRLVGQLGSPIAPDALMQKLRSLARLAMSAGTQKRDFLRRYAAQRPNLTGGFLLERARLQITTRGLDDVADAFYRAGVVPLSELPSLRRRILDALMSAIRAETDSRLLDACVEELGENMDGSDNGTSAINWRPGALPREQLEAAGERHALCDGGTVRLSISEAEGATADGLVDLLEFAWKETAVVRLRIERTPRPERQLTVPF